MMSEKDTFCPGQVGFSVQYQTSFPLGSALVLTGLDLLASHGGVQVRESFNFWATQNPAQPGPSHKAIDWFPKPSNSRLSLISISKDVIISQSQADLL